MILGLQYLLGTFPIQMPLSILAALLFVTTLVLAGYALSTFTPLASVREGGPPGWFLVGYMALSGYIFILASLQLVRPWSMILFLLLPARGLWHLYQVQRARSQFFTSGQTWLSRPLPQWLPFLVPLMYSLLPIVFYDALVYGAGTANFILQNGGFVPAPHFLFYNLTIYSELALVPAVALGEQVPHIVHMLTGLFFFLFLADEATERFQLRNRNWLVPLLVFLPLNLFLLTTVKPDLPAAFFCFAGICAYDQKKWKKSAFLFAFAAGIKPTSLLVPLLYIPLSMIRKKEFNIREHLSMLIPGLVILLPLILKNAFCIGNPLFPFANNSFPSTGWDDVRAALVREEMGAAIRTWTDLLKAPFSFSFNGHGAGGFVGPIFIIFLPFLIFVRRKSESFHWVPFSLLLLVLGSLQGEAFRYLNLVFSLLLIFVAVTVERLNHPLLWSVLLCILSLNALQAFSITEHVHRLTAFTFTRETYDSYLSTYMPALPLHRTINETLKGKPCRIMMAGEARGYYLQVPYDVETAHNKSILSPFLVEAQDPQTFAALLRAKGYTHLLLDVDGNRSWRSYRRMSDEEERKLERFLPHLHMTLRLGPVMLFDLSQAQGPSPT